MMRNALTLEDIKKKYGENVTVLYKEQMRAPFMVHKSGSGIDGALLTDGEKVRCDICSEWYPSLGKHLASKHKISSQEYRVERGLGARTPLATPVVRKKYRDVAINRINRLGDSQVRGLSKNQIETTKRKEARISGRKTMQYRNKFGLCPEQMALRYAVLCLESGKFVDPYSVYSFDRILWKNISKFYGTFPKFFKDTGIDPEKSNWELPESFAEQFDEKLIAIARLREIEPDKNGNYTEKTAREQLGEVVDEVINAFGSWRSATIFAGINSAT